MSLFREDKGRLTRARIREPGRQSPLRFVAFPGPPPLRSSDIRLGSLAWMRALAWNMASGPRTLLGVNMLCTTGNDIGSPCHVAFASLVLPLGPVGRCDTNDVECPKSPWLSSGYAPFVLRGSRRCILPESNPALVAVDAFDHLMSASTKFHVRYRGTTFLPPRCTSFLGSDNVIIRS